MSMQQHVWSKLTGLQIGRYAEYFVKMEFTLRGFDVYSAEVDDRGIDFVIRREPAQYYDIQVKSARKLNYIFMRKDKFALRPNLYLAIVLFTDGQGPDLYLLPSEAWKQTNPLLADRPYEGKRSPPEWGLNLSRQNLPLLEPYRFERVVAQL